MNEFRSLRIHENLGLLLKKDEDLLDPDLIFDIYDEAIQAENSFVIMRSEVLAKTKTLEKLAAELGGSVLEVDFEEGEPIPSEKQSAKTIETLRLAYLASLFAKNFHKVVDLVEESSIDGGDGEHVVSSERRSHSTGYSSWEYMLKSDYIRFPCDEEVGEGCFYIQSDMEVLEWNGSGYDRDGYWKETGFPSKWNNHSWRLPKAITLIADLVWKGSKVPYISYEDFRWIFFSKACGGTYHGRSRYSTSLYPNPWYEFRVNHDKMQYSFPVKNIEWDGKNHITEIRIGLLDDNTTCKV